MGQETPENCRHQTIGKLMVCPEPTGGTGAKAFPKHVGSAAALVPDLIYLKLWLLHLVFVEMTLGLSSLELELRGPLRT